MAPDRICFHIEGVERVVVMIVHEICRLHAGTPTIRLLINEHSRLHINVEGVVGDVEL